MKEPQQYKRQQKKGKNNMGDIFVAGDIHGNYRGLIKSLAEAGWKEGEGKLICVGDVIDRGNENSKVVSFLYEHRDSVYLIRGNHEHQHAQMLRYYQILAKSPEIRKMAEKLCLRYPIATDIAKTQGQLEKYRCTPEERKAILSMPAKSFEEIQRRFIVYTLAWEDASLWQIMLQVMEIMCGSPYDAEHTLYEYFSATNAVREQYEWLFLNQTQELNIRPNTPGAKYENVCITHGNPFGGTFAWDKDEMLPGHRNILYLFGHTPHAEVTRMDRRISGCTYVDLDTSITGRVSVVRLKDFTQ